MKRREGLGLGVVLVTAWMAGPACSGGSEGANVQPSRDTGPGDIHQADTTDAGATEQDVTQGDTGTVSGDAGAGDAADTGLADTGLADTGPADAGTPDAGSCDAGGTRCGAACVDLATDPNHCGRCGMVCPSTAHGSANCLASRCGLRCEAGYMLQDGACAPVALPRLVSPPSGTRVTSLRPGLRWALPSGLDGAEVEVCRDRACTMVVHRLSAVGYTVAPTEDLPSGTLFWRARGRLGTATVTGPTAAWEFRVGERGGPVSAAWGALLDVNGDACSDALVGAPGVAQMNVYLGARGTFGRTPAATFMGPTGAEYAMSAAAAGDLNGDGYADALVGAPEANELLVHLGSPSGLGVTPSARVGGEAGSRFGHSLASAGDVNRDGYGDVIVGLPEANAAAVLLGGPTGLVTPAAITLRGGSSVRRYGYQVAGAGDVNADGYGDVLVGTFGGDEAYLYYGSATGIQAAGYVTLTGPARSDFGKAVAAAGDVNLDGYPDVVVGAFTSGAAYVYHGGARGLSTTAATTLTEAVLDYADVVSSAGDVNQDGYGDVMVLAPIVGQVFVYHGSSSGTRATAAVVVRAGGEHSFGPAGVAMGDADCDGDEDVLLADPERNLAFLFSGGASGLDPTPTFTLEGRAGQFYGRTLALRPARGLTRGRLVAFLARSARRAR